MIRRATNEDIPAILSLYEDYMRLHTGLDDNLVPVTDATGIYSSYLHSILNNDHYYIWVSIENDCINGYVLASILSMPPVFKSRQKVSIYDMAVDKNHRRKGIGRMLVNETVAWAKAKDISLIELNIHAENHLSLQFWQGVGFNIHNFVLRKNLN